MFARMKSFFLFSSGEIFRSFHSPRRICSTDDVSFAASNLSRLSIVNMNIHQRGGPTQIRHMFSKLAKSGTRLPPGRPRDQSSSILQAQRASTNATAMQTSRPMQTVMSQATGDAPKEQSNPPGAGACEHLRQGWCTPCRGCHALGCNSPKFQPGQRGKRRPARLQMRFDP